MNIENKNNSRKLIIKLILVCLFLILLFIIFFLRISFLTMNIYTFGLFSFKTNNFVEEKSKVVSSNQNCIIEVTSNKLEKDIDISEYGVIEKINNHEWAKQEYSNGYTFWSYYEDKLYIVQMYANNEIVFKYSCKNKFKMIKKTFSFMKDE